MNIMNHFNDDTFEQRSLPNSASTPHVGFLGPVRLTEVHAPVRFLDTVQTVSFVLISLRVLYAALVRRISSYFFNGLVWN